MWFFFKQLQPNPRHVSAATYKVVKVIHTCTSVQSLLRAVHFLSDEQWLPNTGDGGVAKKENTANECSLKCVATLIFFSEMSSYDIDLGSMSRAAVGSSTALGATFIILSTCN